MSASTSKGAAKAVSKVLPKKSAGALSTTTLPADVVKGKVNKGKATNTGHNQLTALSSKKTEPTMAFTRTLGRSQRIKKSFKTPDPSANVTSTKFNNKPALPPIKIFIERFDDMLTGQLDNLPPKPPSEVRIFLSSTFSDMRKERNSLVRYVVPKIKEFCYKELDLDFQVVDMRWGVTDDSTNDHMTEKLCLAEIENCQRLSLGPNFVCILGDRYGSRQLPAEMSKSEFEIILKEADELKIEGTELLREWFQLDENACPPLYVLQPIRSRLVHFGDYSPGNEERRKNDSAAWWSVNSKMQEVFRKSAESAHKKKALSDEQKHMFFKSVTEYEIDKGILSASQPASHCLCFFRKFSGLTNDVVGETDATRHVDTVQQNNSKMIDPSSEDLKLSLWNNKIAKKLPSSNITKNQIPWQPGGVDPSHEPHKEYLGQFMEAFEKKVVHLIKSAQDKRNDSIIKSEYYSYVDETLHHLHFCSEKSHIFRGQTETLKKVENILKTKKDRYPLVIHAESGLGKTSIMSKIFTMLPSWIGKQAVRIIRFLGTSPDSTTIYDVLFSVMGQLADVYDQILEPVGYGNIKSLLKYFPRFIRSISRSAKEPIYILLDSIDQLESNDNAYSMDWLPKELPSNVVFILSTLPKTHGILDNARKLLPEESFVELQPLGDDTGEEIIETNLKRHGRNLTQEQRRLITESNANARSPLLLKLLLDRALTWKSYQPVATLQVTNTVRGAINQLFTDLESKYGKTLISFMLGYLTVGMNGLSEVELEGVLSCNDDVLNEVYQYHDPPVEGVVSIPSLLWARVKHDISEYVVERLSFGKKTMYWYHRQFIEAATDRYVSGNMFALLHQDLAQLYLSEDGVRRDIHLSKRKLTIPNADRNVAPQPLVPRNKRKLLALPHHLTCCGNLNVLKDVVLCNLRFIMAKYQGISYRGVLKDYSRLMQDPLNIDEEVVLLYQCLSGLKNLRNPENLPVEFLARLSEVDAMVHIKSLLQQCRSYLESSKKASLIPVYACFDERASPLMYQDEAEAKVLTMHSSQMLIESDHDQWVRLNVVDFKEKKLNSLTLCGGYYASACLDTSGETLVLSLYDKATNLTASEKIYIEQRKVSELSHCLSRDAVDVAAVGSVRIEKMTACYMKPTESVMVAVTFANNAVVVWDSKIKKTVSKDLWSLRGKSGEIKEVLFDNSGPLLCLFRHEGDDCCTVHTSNLKTSKSLDIRRNVMSGRFYDVRAAIAGEAGTALFCLLRVKSDLDKFDDVVAVDCRKLISYNFHIDDLRALCIGYITKKATIPTLFAASHCRIQGFSLLTQEELFAKDLAFGEIHGLAVNFDDGDIFTAIGHKTLQMWKKNGDKIGEHVHEGIADVWMDASTETLVTKTSNNKLSIYCSSSLEKSFLKESGQAEPQTERRDSIDRCPEADVVFFTPDNKYIVIKEQTGSLSVWNALSRELKERFDTGNIDLLIQSGHRFYILDRLGYTVQAIEYHNDSFHIKPIGLPSDAKPVAMTTNKVRDLAYILGKSLSKATLYVINTEEWILSSSHPIKEPFAQLVEDINITLTEAEEFLVVKMRVTQAELNIIKKNQAKDKQVFANYKFAAIDLDGSCDTLIPCHLILTQIPCVGNCMTMLKGNNVLIGRNRIMVVWDIISKKCDQKMVKGTKIPGYFRAFWVENDASWNKHCFGKTMCAATDNNHVVMVGSEDGFVMVYDRENGKNIAGNLKSTKPPHSCKVIHVSVSADGHWGVSVSQDSLLILWRLRGGISDVFSMKLNISVKHVIFSQDSSHLVVTGAQAYNTNKVLMFRVLGGS